MKYPNAIRAVLPNRPTTCASISRTLRLFSKSPCRADGPEIMSEVVHYSLTWRSSHLESDCSVKVFHYIKKERKRKTFPILLLHNHITTLNRGNQLRFLVSYYPDGSASSGILK